MYPSYTRKKHTQQSDHAIFSSLRNTRNIPQHKNENKNTKMPNKQNQQKEHTQEKHAEFIGLYTKMVTIYYVHSVIRLFPYSTQSNHFYPNPPTTICTVFYTDDAYISVFIGSRNENELYIKCCVGYYTILWHWSFFRLFLFFRSLFMCVFF